MADWTGLGRGVDGGGGTTGNPATGMGLAVLAAVAGAVVWAMLTVATDYKIGFAAVGIGLLVGKAVELKGGGDPRLPVPAAVVALLGCLLGDLLTDAHFLSVAVHVPLGELLRKLVTAPSVAVDLFREGFEAFDLVFYAIAAYEGFRFATVGVQRARAAAAASQTWAPPTGRPAGTPVPLGDPS